MREAGLSEVCAPPAITPSDGRASVWRGDGAAGLHACSGRRFQLNQSISHPRSKRRRPREDGLEVERASSQYASDITFALLIFWTRSPNPRVMSKFFKPSKLNQALAGLLCLSNARRGPLCCGGGSTTLNCNCCSGQEKQHPSTEAKREANERKWAYREKKLEARERRREVKRQRRRRGAREQSDTQEQQRDCNVNDVATMQRTTSQQPVSTASPPQAAAPSPPRCDQVDSSPTAQAQATDQDTTTTSSPLSPASDGTTTVHTSTRPRKRQERRAARRNRT